jgi:hypothetical protein
MKRAAAMLVARPKWPLVLVAIAYAASLASMPWEGFWTNDNGLKFIQLHDLLASHYRSFSISWPGAELDPELRFAPIQRPFAFVSDGSLHASYSPIFALLSSPFFRALGFLGLYVLPLAGSLLTLPAVQRLAEMLVVDPALARRAGCLAVLLVAFGTPLWFYSLTFWEHTPAVALCCWSVVACLRQRVRRSARDAALVGLLAGSAVAFRTDAYLFALVVSSVCVLSTSRTRVFHGACTAGAFLVALIPLWIFHWATTGNPLGGHIQAQGWFELRAADYLAQRGEVAKNILLNTHAQPWLSAAIAAPYLVLAAASTSRLASRVRSVAPAAAAIVSVGGVIAIVGHLGADSPMQFLLVANGLFAVSPVLVFAFLLPAQSTTSEHSRVRDACRSRATLLWVLGLYVGSYAALLPSVNSRGLHWGCRFVLPAYPILGALAAAGLATCWRHAKRPAARLAFVAAVVVSLAFQLYALRLLHQRQSFSVEFVSEVVRIQADLIITPLWFVAQDLARVFHDRPIFLVRERDQLRELSARARRSGLDSALLITRWKHGERTKPGAHRVSDGWLRHVDLELRRVDLERVAP